MKRVYAFIVMFLSFFVVGLVAGENVSAVDYFYDAKGTISHYKDDIEVLKFNYDYTLKFTEQSGFYNGVDIYDGNKSVSKELFYGANKIVVEATDYNKLLAWEKDDDRVEVYKYVTNKNNFSSIIWSTHNNSGSYILKDEGLYKIMYIFEGEAEITKYIYVSAQLHDLTIKVEGYEDLKAYSYLNAKVTVKDAYNLKVNKYYYAFGANEENLNYTEFELFSESEKHSDAVVTDVIERSIDFKITDEYKSVNGEKKKLYVKVVKNVNDKEVVKAARSLKAYNLFEMLKANVDFLDNNDQIIEDTAYFKANDTIKVKIVFDIPVVISNLEISFDGIHFVDLENTEEAVQSVLMNYSLNSETIMDCDTNSFILRNKGDSENKLDISLEKNTAHVNKVVAEYLIDIIVPGIDMDNDKGDKPGNVKSHFNLILNVTDQNLSEIEYYFDECTSFQEGKCIDADDYNSENKKISNLNEEQIKELINANVTQIPIMLDENAVGRLDGKSMILYVKATDKTGNITYKSFFEYVVDNVIVDDFSKVLLEQDVVDGGEVIGKKMGIKELDELNIKHVLFKYAGGQGYNACILEGDVHECLKVENYYFSSQLEVVILDKYDNEETYEYVFRYNDLKPKNVEVGEYVINVYNDKEYDAEMSNLINYMGYGQNKLIFNKTVLDKIEESINLSGVPDMQELTKKLILSDNVVLVNSIENELVLPSLMQIMESVGDNEEFSGCALKGKECKFVAYIEYSYKVNGVQQKRYVKLEFVDNTIKLGVDNFEGERVLEVHSDFELYNYKFYNSLNVEVTFDSYSILRTIDFEDMNGNISNSDSVYTNKLGTYTIREQLLHGEEASFPIVYKVVVKDTKAPTLTLNGDKEIVVKKGEDVKDIVKGIEVYDEFDKNIKIEYDLGGFNKNKEGKYTIKYWAVDSSGNRSNEITRTIIVENENSTTTYLILGGIGLFVLLVVIVGIVVERKKERRKS